MKSIKLRQLIDLVAGDVQDGEKRLETIFGWQFEREMAVIRWSLGLFTSLAVASLVAFYRLFSSTNEIKDFEVSWKTILIVAFLVAVSGLYGGYRLYQLRKLHEQYTSALKLYSRFKNTRDFVRRYRGSL